MISNKSSAIPLFRVTLSGKPISGIILVILRDPKRRSILRSNMILTLYMLQIGARVVHWFGVILTG